MSQETHTGTVKFFNEAKGFGFILIDQTHDEIFVGSRDLKINIKQDDRLEFELADAPKGKKAVNVRKI